MYVLYRHTFFIYIIKIICYNYYRNYNKVIKMVKNIKFALTFDATQVINQMLEILKGLKEYGKQKKL